MTRPPVRPTRVIPAVPSPLGQAAAHPAPSARPRRKTRSRWLPVVVIGGVLGFAGVLMLGGMLMIAVLLAAEPRLPEGVAVAGITVGGETLEDAAAALVGLDGGQVMLTDGDRQWLLALAELGVRLNVEATLAQAEAAPRGAALTPVYAVDLAQAQAALTQLSAQVNVPPDARTPGRGMEIPVTLSRLATDAGGELADGVLELDMMELEPVSPETSGTYSGATTTHIVEPAQELGLIAKRYGVSIQDIVALNGIANPDLIYPGQELRIPAAGIYEPTQDEAPPPSTASGRAIVVSVSTQRIYAFEDGRLLRSHLVSTGRPQTPTVLGDYAIQRKYQADDMAGPGYFLPQVPYAMYFYQGYAIHGTYWHNSFGRPMSHGCVNLPSDEARWWFDFAGVGTPVRVVA